MMEEILAHQESYQYVMDSSQVKLQIEQMKRAGDMYNFFKAERIAFLGGTMAGKVFFFLSHLSALQLIFCREKQCNQLTVRFSETCHSRKMPRPV